jgi:hypothetical protein
MRIHIKFMWLMTRFALHLLPGAVFDGNLQADLMALEKDLRGWT